MPWTWTWHIQYYDHWSHFEKCPGTVYSIVFKLLLKLDRASVLRLFGLQPINLFLVINIGILNVIVIYICWVLLAAILIWSKPNTSFYYVSSLIITKLWLSHKYSSQNFSYHKHLESIPFVIFPKATFCCRNWIFYLFNIFDCPDAANKKRCPHRANIERQGSIVGLPIVQ